MKWIVFIALTIFIVGCEKEAAQITILRARVDGDTISFIGHAQRYDNMSNGVLFGNDYQIFNHESPHIRVYTTIDSSMSLDHFNYPDAKAFYGYKDADNVARSFEAIDGYLQISKEQHGILFGEFAFTLVNFADSTDTLHIKDGYFETSLEIIKRTWDY